MSSYYAQYNETPLYTKENNNNINKKVEEDIKCINNLYATFHGLHVILTLINFVLIVLMLTHKL